MPPDDRIYLDRRASARPGAHRRRGGERCADAALRAGAARSSPRCWRCWPCRSCSRAGARCRARSRRGWAVLVDRRLASPASVAGALVTGCDAHVRAALTRTGTRTIIAGGSGAGATALFWPLFGVQLGRSGSSRCCCARVHTAGPCSPNRCRLLVGAASRRSACVLDVFPASASPSPSRVLESGGGAIEAIGGASLSSKAHWCRRSASYSCANLLAVLCFPDGRSSAGRRGGVSAGGNAQSPIFVAAVMIGDGGLRRRSLCRCSPSLLQYFTLVERREGPALAARVEQIGADEDERPLF